MFEPPVPGEELTISRLHRPDHDLLVTLEAYDFEAFGLTGLRTYDLAVVAEAGAIFLAHLYDEVAGGCQLLRMLEEPGFFYVVGFYIRPKWQGRTLGRTFLLKIAQEVQTMGGEGMVLTVAPSNTAAISLYKDVGFEDETYVADFYGEGQGRHILRWRFDEGGLRRSV